MGTIPLLCCRRFPMVRVADLLKLKSNIAPAMHVGLGDIRNAFTLQVFCLIKVRLEL